MKADLPPQRLSQLTNKEIHDEVAALKTKHQSLWKMCLLISEHNFHLATQISKAFKDKMRSEGLILENAFEARPSPRFESLLIVDDVVDTFTKEKNLTYNDTGSLREYLTTQTPSSRTKSNTASDKQAYRKKLFDFAEGWYGQRNDKTSS